MSRRRLYALYARTRGGPFDPWGPNKRRGCWEYRVIASSARQAADLARREVFAPGPSAAGILRLEWDGWSTGCATCAAGARCPEHLILAPYLAEREFV